MSTAPSQSTERQGGCKTRLCGSGFSVGAVRGVIGVYALGVHVCTVAVGVWLSCGKDEVGQRCCGHSCCAEGVGEKTIVW